MKGQVLYNGNPLAGADVSLESKAKSRLGNYCGKTNDEGEFVIVAAGTTPIPPGTYKVVISKYVDKRGNVPDPDEREQMRARGELINMVPDKYHEYELTELFAEVKEGENVLAPFQLRGPKNR